MTTAAEAGLSLQYTRACRCSPAWAALPRRPLPAVVVAANGLLEKSLPDMDLLSYAIRGEQYASNGLHADNVAPSLLGGMVF